jgi:molybdenum cofactor cytidylyltransferase
MSNPGIPAIVPAAGKSQRMGRPKLLVPFQGQPLIGRVIAALRQGGAEPVIVVAPPSDAPEGPSVAQAADQAGATVISPSERPAEMRESVELAMGFLERIGRPQAVLLTPGDNPGLTGEMVGLILQRWAEEPTSVLIPRAAGRRGHPIILPWDLASQISSLSREEGINALVAKHTERVVELDVPHAELAEDLDTPLDLERWQLRERGTLKLRLFAVAKERAGQPEIAIELPLPATVAELRFAVALQHPELRPLASRVMIAVDSEYASENTLILPGALVALIPPVSGG